jgi:hypothetical protein
MWVPFLNLGHVTSQFFFLVVTVDEIQEFLYYPVLGSVLDTQVLQNLSFI